jgi:hypothetical protein
MAHRPPGPESGSFGGLRSSSRERIAVPGLLVALIAAAVLLAAPAAPVPKPEPKNALYFPVRAGAAWVYQIGETDRVQSEDVVAEVKRSDGATVVTVSTDVGGDLIPWQTVSISDKGLFRMDGGGPKPARFVCLLRLPTKAGDTWESKEEFLGGEVTVTRTAHAPEWVEVPAGKYKAVRVESEFTFPSLPGAVRATAWYAPGVALVKEVRGGEVFKVLKSFTPDKD